MVVLSVSNLEVVGSGPRSGCHKISLRSATCGEMQNLGCHNPEICHKFLSLQWSGVRCVHFTKTVFSVKFVAKFPTSQKVVPSILHSGPKLLGGVGGRCPCMHNS